MGLSIRVTPFFREEVGLHCYMPPPSFQCTEGILTISIVGGIVCLLVT